MSIQRNIKDKDGTCNCGRSPTGNCVGWHSLTEDEFESKTDADKDALWEEANRKDRENGYT